MQPKEQVSEGNGNHEILISGGEEIVRASRASEGKNCLPRSIPLAVFGRRHPLEHFQALTLQMKDA
jgi:hypothetical protein